MFINQKSVDNYLTEYRDIDLTFSCKHYKISLNVYKTLFMVTVYQLSDNAFWIPVKQETYDSWDIATYNFNALCCQYIEKSTKMCQEEKQK